MPDRLPVPVAPPPLAGQLSQSRTSWVLDIGRHRIALTRLRESRTAAPVRRESRRPAWPLAIGVFTSVSAFGLAVAGAFATSHAVEPTRYLVSLAVPGVTTPVAATAIPRAAHARPRKPRAATPPQSPLEADDAPYIDRALTTGEFQEWTDAAGLRRFLTAGPARSEGAASCRDLALLIRRPEGAAHVRSLHRCTTAPVSEPPPADDAAPPPPDQPATDE